MEQKPSWEANWPSASQETPNILWNPVVHYHIGNSPPPVPILSQAKNRVGVHAVKNKCKHLMPKFSFNGSTAPWGPRLPHFFFEASRSHFLDTPHSAGLLWTRDQLVAETSTWQHTTLTIDRFEPTILVSERPQTHALDRTATGIGLMPKYEY
jgi:hypothetical protein